MKLDLANKIKEKINSKEIKMKPKIYFIAGSILMVTGIIFSFLLSTFFVNVIKHKIRVNNLPNYLQMERFGRKMFLTNFPWEILFAAILFLILGTILLRKYDISYKKSFTLILISIFTSIFISAFFMDMAGLNSKFKEVRGIKGIYKSNLDDKFWLMGTLNDWQLDYAIIQPKTGPERIFIITDDTWIPPHKPLVGSCTRVVYEKTQKGEIADGFTPCKPPRFEKLPESQPEDVKGRLHYREETRLPTR